MVFTSLHFLKAEQMNYRKFSRMNFHFFFMVSFGKVDSDWGSFFLDILGVRTQVWVIFSCAVTLTPYTLKLKMFISEQIKF